MKLCAVVLVFTALFVLQAWCAEDDEPDCAKQEFWKNDACCNTPVGDLVTEKIVKSCKPTKTLLKWINDFMMNTWLKFDKNTKKNKFNLTSTTNNKLMCNVAPFVNCVFDKFQIMNLARTFWNGTNAMKAILMTKRTDYWTENLAGVVEEGIQYAAELFNQTISCGKGSKRTDVYIGNLWLVQYVQSYISMICPNATYTYSETNPSKCQKQMDENFHICHYAIEQDAWGRRKSELPQILRDARQTIFKSPQGKRLKAMLAARENA